jgi:sulfur-carrier protein
MTVIVLRGPLRKLAGNAGEHDVGGATVREVIESLERDHPALDGWILDERGRVRRHINVWVNGEYSNADTPVAPGDRVDVLPAISGGMR